MFISSPNRPVNLLLHRKLICEKLSATVFTVWQWRITGGLNRGPTPLVLRKPPSDSKKNGTEGDRFVLFVLISIPSVICWSILCLVRLTDDVAQVSMRITGGYMVELPIQPAPAAKKTFAPYKLLFV